MGLTKSLITGGAGFLGSNLIKRLLDANEEVICLDNFYTGRKNNIEQFLNNPKFKCIDHDVVEPIDIDVDKIWHLACPASPVNYQRNPIKTTRTSFLGTYNMLELAHKKKAKLLFASTSEVYGDPKVHPQSEIYNGNVNTTGIRSCYDEGKRIAETLCFDYGRIRNCKIGIVRIFNTYGPGMQPDDGRVISNLIVQALQGKELTIYGNGEQTRSFCYVDDLIEGFILAMNSNYKMPINLGNPKEVSINKLSQIIIKKINKDLKIIYKDLPKDDPTQRCPEIDLAKKELGWQVKINLDQGLDKTIEYFKKIDAK